MVSNTNTVGSRFKKWGLNNPYHLVAAARKGVKAKLFYDFADVAKLSEKSLAAIINLSARTVSNYKEGDKSLEPVYSEHLLKLIHLPSKPGAINSLLNTLKTILNTNMKKIKPGNPS